MADRIVVMNAGRVEQVGTPLELYDTPANLFVADFIGSPSMNFIRGTLTRTGSGVVVEADDGTRLAAPEQFAGRAGQKVVYGVRPEHFVLAPDSAGSEATVEVIEPTGANIEVFAALAGERVCAIFSQRHPFKPGDKIRLATDLDKVHLFDARTGRRL
jgi:multiple sugar transport system ATP-binding protein